MEGPRIVCLTPVRNEGWILDRFLRCAELWADHIIIADQGSTDDTREIARGFSKVTLIDNPNGAYDESARQTLLIKEARKRVPAPRLLLALDADEVLTGNFHDSPEWQAVLSAPTGTVFRFRWANLCPGMRQAWLSERAFAWGFMDDGSEHQGKRIHSARVPATDDHPQRTLDEIKVLHYQYTDPDRTRSKHRWYQCFERVQNPDASAVRLFDTYHHFHGLRPTVLQQVDPVWLRYYEDKGIDMTSVAKPADGLYWWDPLVLEMIKERSPAFFARENIWEAVPEMAARLGVESLINADPRSRAQKWLHGFLTSQASLENRRSAKLIKSVLKRLGY